MEFQYYYVDNQSQWPEIDYWDTPTFYFYRDGKLVEKIAGWPKGGRAKELLQAARSVGLLKSDAGAFLSN